MATQVIDDFLDLPIDKSSNVSNIFFELLEETPREKDLAIEHLESISWKHLDFAWARCYLPETCKKASDLIQTILMEIEAVSIRPKVSARLVRVIDGLARSSLGE